MARLTGRLLLLTYPLGLLPIAVRCLDRGDASRLLGSTRYPAPGALVAALTPLPVLLNVLLGTTDF